ncbi:uncharacterized protein LOC118764664 [Octopus sinensis]|uniref:Uncharacterized protein LOC118764664 n=1 Tax=Octopus sinensis TaxID=2607531 RepID=A0A7E6F2P8_9MOLL|nr:uncharacterized protein LOC118764664 [Octopus sinensis]
MDVTHTYVDDGLKLRSANMMNINRQFEIITTFSRDAGMEFGQVNHVIRKVNLHVITFPVLLFQICLGSNAACREYYGTRIHPSVTDIPEADKLNKMSNIRSKIDCFSHCMAYSKCGMIIYSVSEKICLDSNVACREYYGIPIQPPAAAIPEVDKLIQASNIQSNIECFSLCMANSACGMIIYSVSDKVCILRKIQQSPGATSFIDIPPNSIYTMLQAPECPTSAGYTYQPELKLCFRIGEKKITWNKAAAVCNKDRGQLIHIKNLQIMEYLLNEFKKWPEEHYYFGLCKDIKKNAFVWQNGEALTFSYWMEKRPDNLTGNQNCGCLDLKGNHKWNDVRCNVNGQAKHICEIVLR